LSSRRKVRLKRNGRNRASVWAHQNTREVDGAALHHSFYARKRNPHGAGSEAIGLVNRRSSTRGHQRQLLARRGPNGLGRACLLCPGSSDVDLFRYGEGIIDLDSEVPDSTFDLGVTEQELHGPQITSTSVNQGCLGPS